MKATTFKSASVLLATLLMVGCATTKKEPVVQPMTALEQELANASNSAAESLRSLAITERAIVGETELDKIPAFDAGIAQGDALRKTKTIKFGGPIQNLVGKIAADTGYNFSIIGKAPSVPVVVKVNAKGVQAVNILRDASLQAGLRAKITIKAEEKVIELAFAN